MYKFHFPLHLYELHFALLDLLLFYVEPVKEDYHFNYMSFSKVEHISYVHWPDTFPLL